jgi:hypothetical protein
MPLPASTSNVTTLANSRPMTKAGRRRRSRNAYDFLTPATLDAAGWAMCPACLNLGIVVAHTLSRLRIVLVESSAASSCRTPLF